jgi:hypothetical protein
MQSAPIKLSLIEYVPLRLDFEITIIEEILAGVKDIDYIMTGSHQFKLGNIENKY